MGEWKNVRVGELGKIITGKTPKTSISDNYGGRIPFLTPSDNMSVKYVGKTSKTLTEKGLLEVKNAILPENSVCVSCIGSDLGKAVITTCPTVTNQQINSIIVDEKSFDVSFVYYAMQILGKKMNFISKTSTAVPIVNKSSFSSYEIKCPPREDQKRIAAVLSALDSKIECNKKINDNLFAQMQALYAAWFIDCIPFGGIKPSSWQKTSIYTIADIIYGAPFSSKQFNTDGKGIPIIRIRDLKEQKVATYTTEKHPKGYLLQAGDIVVGMDGEFVPYIWGSDEAWLNQRVCVFKNKRLKGKAFLYFTIKPLLYAIEQTQVATTVIHIGKKDFDAFEITLPDPRVLDSFDAITTPMVEKIVENRFEIKQLELLRDALLPKLMSGELDVSNIQL